MAYVLQVDFKMNGPWGDEMAEGFSDLAKSINEEEGFMWKIWTESPETNEAGGIYIFETKETAQKYIEMHSKRLAGFGIIDVNAKIFAINSKLTEITNGPLKIKRTNYLKLAWLSASFLIYNLTLHPSTIQANI